MKSNKAMTVIQAVILGIGLITIPSLSNATRVNVVLDTSPLGGEVSSVVFDLLDGDTVPNNSVILSNFSFGGGSYGTPNFTCTSGFGISCGGISGNLSSVVTLNDSFDFFNEFTAEFIPGTGLSFTMDFSENFSGGTPDSLFFSLLDSGGRVIPTSDPLGTDTFLSAEMSSSGIIEVFESVSLGIAAPTVTPVPEPGILTLLCVGMVRLACYRFPAKQGRLSI
jgi:hypothetical protein